MRNSYPALLAIVVLVLAACGKDQPPASPRSPATITDLATILSAPDRRTLVGRKVDIAKAPVGKITGFYVFWIGEGHSAVPVARYDKLNHPGTTTPVRAGRHAAITGTIRLPDNVDPNDPIWKTINEAERRDIMDSHVYIAADKVTPLP